jgi:hypothetical protein
MLLVRMLLRLLWTRRRDFLGRFRGGIGLL